MPHMAVKIDGAQVGPLFTDTRAGVVPPDVFHVPSSGRRHGLVHGDDRVHDADLRVDRPGPRRSSASPWTTSLRSRTSGCAAGRADVDTPYLYRAAPGATNTHVLGVMGTGTPRTFQVQFLTSADVRRRWSPRDPVHVEDGETRIVPVTTDATGRATIDATIPLWRAARPRTSRPRSSRRPARATSGRASW